MEFDMRLSKLVVVNILFIFLFSSSSLGDVFHYNHSTDMSLLGTIDSKTVRPIADRLLTETKKKEIRLLINSPGGSVPAGLVLVQAMNMARGRGITTSCVVTRKAHSMAFYILMGCDKKYLLRTSSLMWHPPTYRLDGRYGRKELESLAYDLRMNEDILVDLVIKGLGADRKFVLQHLYKETQWTGEKLQALFPDAFTIVGDVTGVSTLFYEADLSILDGLIYPQP